MEETLEFKVGKILRERGLKLVVSESCTGGLIGHRITNIAGSSDYYLGSITAYAYEVKERLLGVNHHTLAYYGAVSRAVVIEMALGVRHALDADFPFNKTIGISVSGIAGPGGGIPGKPVGLVWVGLSTVDGNQAWRFLWNGDRIQNKELTAEAALKILLGYLEKNLPPEDY